MKLKEEYLTETEKKLDDLLFDNFKLKLVKNDYILYSELIRILNTFFKNYIDLFDKLINIEHLSKKDRDFYLEKIDKALTNLNDFSKKYIGFDFKYFISILENKKQKIEKINADKKKIIEIENTINLLEKHKNINNKLLIENVKKKFLNKNKELEYNLKKI